MAVAVRWMLWRPHRLAVDVQLGPARLLSGMDAMTAPYNANSKLNRPAPKGSRREKAQRPSPPPIKILKEARHVEPVRDYTAKKKRK